MGLLDDAIRQHLELKRKRGADPSEVAEKEREAFGPARGGESDAGADATTDRTAPAGGAVAAGIGDETPADRDSATALSHDAEDDIEWSDALPARAARDDVADEPSSRAAPSQVPPEDGLESAGELTEEYRVGGLEDEEPPSAAPDADPLAPDDAAGDDVLEETPEFLQDTPEHDRLWFEQKPPRDFDF
jgi:diadenosine tetraphosphatase ApaH/serine/threonine PP2A family protein phosphatase